MPRNMSFMLTKLQIESQSKTVTRRLGWKDLKEGTVLNAVEKGMGLKAGEKVKKICQIFVVNARRERLDKMLDRTYGDLEANKEGFQGMTGPEFVEMFCRDQDCTPETEVTRIEFDYLDDE